MNEQGKSKRQQLRDKRAREQARSKIFSIGLIVVGVLVVFGLIIWPTLSVLLFPPPAPDVPPARERPATDGNSMGDPNAPVTITEYSDYQCPYCRRFWDETEDQLVQAYVVTGQVRFVYRSLGGFIGPESLAAAEAAYCAADQDKFWEMHDIIFFNQNGENIGTFSDPKLKSFATAIGLNMDQFNTCFDKNTYASRIQQDEKDGSAAGVKATPSFVLSYVVNGVTKTKLIEGAMGLSTFQTEIEAALAEMGIQ